jgi:hypothetical protein
MTPQEELRMAWALWHMLSQLTEILWERYEEEFLGLCIEMDRTSPQEFGRGGPDNGHT